MKKFPSIEQFRHVIRAERDSAAFRGEEPGRRVYVGTVKLHGTNAGISQNPAGELTYLSRNRKLAIGDDNAGFAGAMIDNENIVDMIFSDIRTRYLVGADDTIAVFGEWCGQGIQKGVAINKCPKMFVIFSVLVGEYWLSSEQLRRFPESIIFNINDFPAWSVEIDFARPELVQNELIELTLKVEEECPVGAAFGHKGIGEGIVWTPADGNRDPRFWFKVKGEKHSVSKVVKLASVDPEVIRKRDDLLTALVTTNRLQQGLDLHTGDLGHQLDMRSIGDYLRWVFADITKEETDTIEASGFTVKELGKPVSDIAKRFYLAAMNQALVA